MKFLAKVFKTRFKEKSINRDSAGFQYIVIPFLVGLQRGLERLSKVLGRSKQKPQSTWKAFALAKKLINLTLGQIQIMQKKLFGPHRLDLVSKVKESQDILESFSERKPEQVASLKAKRDQDLQDLDNEFNYQNEQINEEITLAERDRVFAEKKLETSKEKAGFSPDFPSEKIKKPKLGVWVFNIVMCLGDVAVMLWAWLKASNQNLIEAIGMVTGSILVLILVPDLLARFLGKRQNYQSAQENCMWQIKDALMLTIALGVFALILLVFVELRQVVFQTSFQTVSKTLQYGISVLGIAFPIMAFVVNYFHHRRNEEVIIVQKDAQKLQAIKRRLQYYRSHKESLRLTHKADRSEVSDKFTQESETLNQIEATLNQDIKNAKKQLEKFDLLVQAETELTQNSYEKSLVHYDLSRLKKKPDFFENQKKDSNPRPGNRPFFRVFIPIIFAIGLGACNPSTEYVGVAIDCTEPEIETQRFLSPYSILETANLDTIDQFQSGALIEMWSITGGISEPKTSILIEPQNIVANPFHRKKDVLKSLTKIDHALQTLCLNHQKGSKATQIYLPLCHRIKAVNRQDKSYESYSFIIVSDFLENSVLANFYNLKEADIPQEIQRIQQYETLPNLSNWRIVLVPLPNATYSQKSQIALRFFQNLLEEAGASVSIGL